VVLTDTKFREDDRSLDQTLRPKSWDEYIGQELIKKNLKILIQAAQERGEPIEHLLFYGPPGLGKTTLAHLISRELNAQVKVTSGPAIEKVGPCFYFNQPFGWRYSIYRRSPQIK